MANPPISVVMAVYNGMPFLKEAVDSILLQSFQDFEFIIVDDGSIDESWALLESIAEFDSRVKPFKQNNLGLTRSLNIALSQASGDFVARMDSDDIAHPKRFDVQFHFLVKHPEVVLLGSEVELITEDGHELGPRTHPRDHDMIRKRLLLGDGAALTHPAVMIRRSALDIVGFYDEQFTTSQDLDLFLRLSEVGRVQNLPEILLSWRQHANSINRTKFQTWRDMKCLALYKCFKRHPPERLSKEFFPLEAVWGFPNKPLSLAKLAASNGRWQSAFCLILKGFKSRRNLRTSLLQILSMFKRFF